MTRQKRSIFLGGCLGLVLLLIALYFLCIYQKPAQFKQLQMELPFGYTVEQAEETGQIEKYGHPAGGIVCYPHLSDADVSAWSVVGETPAWETVARFLTEDERQRFEGDSTKLLGGGLYSDFDLSVEYPNDPENKEHYFFLDSDSHTLVDIWFYMNQVSDRNQSRIISSIH